MKNIKGKNMRRTLAAALAAAMLLPIAGCGSNQDEPSGGNPDNNNSGTPEVTEVKVGYTTLQSGAMAAVGPLIDTCVNIAKEDFEATHDVKIDLVIEDAGSTVEEAIDATVRLIDDGVSCIIGIVRVCKGQDAGVPGFNRLANRAFGLIQQKVYTQTPQNPNGNIPPQQ